MDVIYPVRPGDNNEELRFSLRSLAANIVHDRVWLVGHRPPWAANVGHIRGNLHDEMTRNVADNIRLACVHPDVADDIVIFNDDFFVMGPAVPPVWFREPLDDHLQRVSERTWWGRSLHATRRWLALAGIDNPLSYELHVPFPADKSKMADVLAPVVALATVPQWRTVYGNWWDLDADVAPDCKVYSRKADWEPEWPFLSSTDGSFARGEIGRHVRQRFTVPCRYEQ